MGWRSPGAAVEGSGKLSFNGYRVSLWGDEKVLEMTRDDGCTTCEYT